jgi:hypothetical protein
MGTDIEPEELAILKSLLILRMQVRTMQLESAMIEIIALLSFIEYGMI